MRGSWGGAVSTLISGAQRLPNGNTLITEGGTGRVFEITKAGQIVWEYVSPFVGNVAGGGGFIGPNGVYRAYRVPHSWLPWQVRTKGVQAVCGRR